MISWKKSYRCYTWGVHWFYSALSQLKTKLCILKWFKKHSFSNSHKSKSLTVSTIPSFKANSARASIVIYLVYARSIVYTRVGITFISVWKEPRWEDLFSGFVSGLVIESRWMDYVTEKKFCKWVPTKELLQKSVFTSMHSIWNKKDKTTY